MFKANSHKNEELDRLGKAILRSVAAGEEETEAAATSPFLLTRVRAAIARGQRQPDEAAGWLSMILVARRAVPAMALVATLTALLTVWSVQTTAPVQGEDEPLIALDPGVEQTVLASKNGLSRDEVFNIVVDRNYEVRGK